MFRSPRLNASLSRPVSLVRSLPLLRSLLLGTCAVTTTLVATSVLVGCQDENAPEYWFGKLEDPAWRPRAVKRIAQFYEDALSKNNKDPEHPDVKAMLEKVVTPMTKMYVDQYDAIDENTREELINMLAGFRDPRTEPALKRAFEEYGKKGRGAKDVKWAARAVRDMKLKSAAADVFATFKKTKPSTKEGAYFREVNEALLAVADPAWTPDLIAMLDSEFPILKDKSPDLVSELKDKTYQTITAAQVLGELGAGSAAPALIKAFLDPLKRDAANEILLALTKIGKPSADEAVKLLQNKSPELADFHKKQLQKQTNAERPPDGSPHVAMAAMILGVIGRKEGIAPLIETIKATKDDGERAQMLTFLAKLPHTPEVKAAFLEGLKDMPDDADMSPTLGGGNAVQALAEPASLFFDPAFVEALLDKGSEMKKTEILPKSLLALAAIKVMDESQVGAVTKFVQSLGKGEGGLVAHLENVQRGLGLATGVLSKCKKDAACYLDTAAKPESQANKAQIAGMKGLYMFGILKGADGSKDLIGKLASFEDGAMRYVVSQVIDHNTPNGSVDLAKQIDAVIGPRADSPDRDKAAVDKPLRDLVYRLRARAQ